MFIMVEIILSSSRFQIFFFFWGTMTPDSPRGKGLKGLFFEHSHLQNHYTTTIPSKLLMKNDI